MRDRIDQEPDTLIASKEIKQQEFIMACFYELILLHNKIYGRCNEFLRAIIFRKYISQSNKSSNVTHLLPPFPEVFYTKLQVFSWTQQQKTVLRTQIKRIMWYKM